MTSDRSSLRGRDVRLALHGEQPAKSPAPMASTGFQRRDPRLLRAAIVCGLLALGCLYFATQAHCEERKSSGRFTAAIGSYLALSGVDAGMTAACVAKTSCTERNPAWLGTASRPGVFTAAKLGLASGLAASAWHLRKEHPRAAWVAVIGMVGDAGRGRCSQPAVAPQGRPMNWRCLFGHSDGAPFSAEEGALNVRCSECGTVSPGAAIPAAAPRVTQPGDPRRHVLYPQLRIAARRKSA